MVVFSTIGTKSVYSANYVDQQRLQRNNNTRFSNIQKIYENFGDISLCLNVESFRNSFYKWNLKKIRTDYFIGHKWNIIINLSSVIHNFLNRRGINDWRRLASLITMYSTIIFSMFYYAAFATRRRFEYCSSIAWYDQKKGKILLTVLVYVANEKATKPPFGSQNKLFKEAHPDTTFAFLFYKTKNTT